MKNFKINFEVLIDCEFDEFLKNPRSDNYYFYRGYVMAMFRSRNITEKQFDAYLEKAKLIYYKER